MRKWIFASVALLIGVPAAAQQVEETSGPAAELALSNDTLSARYLSEVDGSKGTRFVGGVFLGEERDLVLDAGMMLGVDLGRRFDFSVGPKLYAALLRDENEDVMAMSLGAEIRFYFDPQRRFALSGQAFYAPDILSFGSADNLVDLSARAEMQVAEDFMAFVGMRWFEFDLTNNGGERTLQEELFVGLRYDL
ncbi:MAG TPA: YfaZ family outer membrane protein [Steroidobacteraceae bacterium]|jgi:hypothetical protein|nr:YfaZ family outer membrane protein [Steroidobacteraceae bacterium]